MNRFFNESKRGPIVNILKVADTGIILDSQGNSPKRGILKNSFSRPVGWVGCGSRANGAPCPTPINVVGLLDEESRSSVHNVRRGPGGCGQSREGSVDSMLEGARGRQGNSGLVGLCGCSSGDRSGVGASGGLVGLLDTTSRSSVHKTEYADGQTNELRIRIDLGARVTD